MGEIIRVCPKCRSPNIEDVNKISGWTPPIYHCNNCGYEGIMILEVDAEELKKFKDNSD